MLTRAILDEARWCEQRASVHGYLAMVARSDGDAPRARAEQRRAEALLARAAQLVAASKRNRLVRLFSFVDVLLRPAE